MRTRAVVLPLLLAILGTLLYATPAHAAPVRIMPLGDSITGSPGCWRALLWNRLQSTGHTNIDFVGTLPTQGCGVAHDGDNEGHGGYLATNIAAQNQLVPWLAATTPDIVVMHLGTNDVWSNIAPATILGAFTTLVGQMRASNPSMKILVAQIIPMNPSQCSACAQRAVNFNAAVPAWAAANTTAQSPITVVDQWTGFSTSADTYDGVHPNAAGDQKISDRWYPALTAALGGGTTDTTPPTTPGTPTPGSLSSTGATLTWTPSTDSGGSGLAGYDVYREMGGTDQLLGSTTTPSLTLTGLTPATAYQVYVRARDGAGNLSQPSGLAAFTTQPGGTGGGCTAAATVQTQWSTGYVVQPVTVANPGTSTLNGWTVTFTLPAGHAVTGYWNAAVTVSGQTVTAKNLAYNGTVAPGQSTSFGFQASRPSGNSQLPTGYACAA
ncbi:cellulose binding domain-containing protein [Nonomuraea sp. NPDC050663]|uniref:cellulose binding domain-containing protein n=1 Tax=Nonomuraea sp. NPDC050663 TaxID=3364370 RepID=UPI0037AB5D5B